MRTHFEHSQNICIDGKWANKMSTCTGLGSKILAAKFLHSYQPININWNTVYWATGFIHQISFSNTYKKSLPHTHQRKKRTNLCCFNLIILFFQFFRTFIFRWQSLLERPPGAPKLFYLCTPAHSFVWHLRT